MPLAERVKHAAPIPVQSVGLITAAAQADEIVRNNRADMVLLGREMLRDPNWALHAAQELHCSPVELGLVPPQYLRAF